jgi:hypothetical protein
MLTVVTPQVPSLSLGQWPQGWKMIILVFLSVVRLASCKYSSYPDGCCRLRMKCDGTRAETRFRLSAERTSHLNRRGRQFSRLLAADVCASAVVMLDTPCSEVVWKSTGYPIHSPVSPSLPLPASPCAITFQLDSTSKLNFAYPFS